FIISIALHSFSFSFTDTLPTYFYILSLHDALPILTNRTWILVCNMAAPRAMGQLPFGIDQRVGEFKHVIIIHIDHKKSQTGSRFWPDSRQFRKTVDQFGNRLWIIHSSMPPRTCHQVNSCLL